MAKTILLWLVLVKAGCSVNTNRQHSTEFGYSASWMTNADQLRTSPSLPIPSPANVGRTILLETPVTDTVSKKDIVAQMAKDAGISQKDAAAALDSFTTLVAKSAKKNKRVSIVGFGSFSLTKRAARKGRNPATGEEIKIKASKSVSFKAGKALKDSL